MPTQMTLEPGAPGNDWTVKVDLRTPIGRIETFISHFANRKAAVDAAESWVQSGEADRIAVTDPSGREVIL